MQTCSGSALCHFPHALEQLPQHLQHSFNSTNRLLPSRNSSCECKLSNLHSSSSSIKGCLLQFWNSHCWIIMLVIMMLLFVCHTHIYIYTFHDVGIRFIIVCFDNCYSDGEAKVWSCTFFSMERDIPYTDIPDIFQIIPFYSSYCSLICFSCFCYFSWMCWKCFSLTVFQKNRLEADTENIGSANTYGQFLCCPFCLLLNGKVWDYPRLPNTDFFLLFNYEP